MTSVWSVTSRVLSKLIGSGVLSNTSRPLPGTLRTLLDLGTMGRVVVHAPLPPSAVQPVPRTSTSTTNTNDIISSVSSSVVHQGLIKAHQPTTTPQWLVEELVLSATPPLQTTITLTKQAWSKPPQWVAEIFDGCARPLPMTTPTKHRELKPPQFLQQSGWKGQVPLLP